MSIPLRHTPEVCCFLQASEIPLVDAFCTGYMNGATKSQQDSSQSQWIVRGSFSESTTAQVRVGSDLSHGHHHRQS